MNDPKRTFRREQLKGVAWAIPLSILASLVTRWLGDFSENAWGVTAALLPLAAVTWYLGRPLFRDRRLVLGGGFLPFFLCYVLLFSLASTSEVLNGKRVPLLGYEDAVPRNFLGLGWLEDWHYAVAKPGAEANDILVVLLPALTNRDESRLLFASLIRSAIENDARGIAFDYFMDTLSNVDQVLCTTVGQAERAGVDVIFGYRLEERNGGLARRPLPPTLAECISNEQLGSLSGYREADGVIRMVPLFVNRDPTRSALSYRIATSLDPSLSRGGNALVQFAEPQSMPIIEVEDRPDAADAAQFRDRFVIVGSNRPGDHHETPYGELPGVVIHAYTTHGLLEGELIRRLDHRWTFPIVFLVCFILVGIQAWGGRTKLFVAAGLFLLAIFVGCALAMFSGRLWVDASYPIVAVLGMTVLLQGGAAAQQGRIGAVVNQRLRRASGAVRKEEAFDVFLSHNGADKQAVRVLADTLEKRGIRAWLDERELPPGRPWQEEIERVLESVRSAVILVGPDGMGPWEIVEMRASLEECVRREMPVIPILLPGAPDEPELPLFLRRHTWVDLRSGLKEEGLDRIEWGITGIKPGK